MTQPENKPSFIYRVGVVRLIVFIIIGIVVFIGTYLTKPASVEAPLITQPSEPSSQCEHLLMSGVDTENIDQCLSSVKPCSPEQLAYEQCIHGLPTPS